MKRQVKLVRTQHYFRLISHPLMESIKFAHIKPLDSIKGKTYGRIIVLKSKQSLLSNKGGKQLLSGLNRNSDIIAVN